MIDSFSNRFGFTVPDAEITIRGDAPEELRAAIILVAERIGMTPTMIRSVMCKVLLVRPDPDNWTDYPNVYTEINWLIDGCAWYKVYDIAEALYEAHPRLREQFSNDLNQFFREKGIGWELRDGRIEFRGQGFSQSTQQAVNVLKQSNRPTAANEIDEAIRAISRRPEPDATGAAYHAMAALEATSRDISGQHNATLGKLIREIDLPKPLDTAIEKMWGYASDNARHVREGKTVNDAEAELIVSISSALCTFLSRRDEAR